MVCKHTIEETKLPLRPIEAMELQSGLNQPTNHLGIPKNLVLSLAWLKNCCGNYPLFRPQAQTAGTGNIQVCVIKLGNCCAKGQKDINIISM